MRPTATLGEFKGLEVPRREPDAPDERIAERLEAERERMARLEPVERPAESGDFLVIDFVGSIDGEPFQGGEGRDQPLELGSGSLVPGFEDGLLGASAGEERTVAVTFPDDYGAEALAGQEASFAVTVKRVQEKHVPDLDDGLADAAGFDTLDELRDDIRERLVEADRANVETDFRQAAVDAAVDAASVDVPEQLAQARAEELVHDVIHSMEHRGISKDAYLKVTGKTEEELLEDARPAAERALRREAVLAAIVEAESIAPGDAEVEAELADAAAAEGVSVRKLLERIKSAGRLEDLRRDLASRRAADIVVEQATPIPVEQAEARDKLWTPEKDEPAGAGKGGLWTPDS